MLVAINAQKYAGCVGEPRSFSTVCDFICERHIPDDASFNGERYETVLVGPVAFRVHWFRDHFAQQVVPRWSASFVADEELFVIGARTRWRYRDRFTDAAGNDLGSGVSMEFSQRVRPGEIYTVFLDKWCGQDQGRLEAANEVLGEGIVSVEAPPALLGEAQVALPSDG